MRNSDVVTLWHVDVFPDPGNPRRHFDEAALDELANSIKEHGLLQPIVVRPKRGLDRAERNEYWIVAGERRWRACGKAGLKEIGCIVHWGLDDAAALKLALVENLQRVDLDPLEEAEGYRQLHQVLGLRQREIAEAVHRSQPAVANRMRLLELPDDVQERIRSGELTAAHGVALARWKDYPGICSKLAEIAVGGKYTTHQLEESLPCTYELQQAGLITYVYTHTPMGAECPKCPQYRNVHYSDYCLKPECYRERQRQAQEAARQQSESAIAQAQESGEKVLLLKDLEYGTYEQLYGSSIPSGCKPDCDRRMVALDGNAIRQTVCTDVKCLRRLRKSDIGKKVAEEKRQREQLLAVVRTKAANLTEVGRSEIAVLCALVAGRYSVNGWAEVCARHGIEGQPGYGGPSDWPMQHRRGEGCLADSLDPLTMVKIVLEAVLVGQVKTREEVGGTPRYAEWWTEGEQGGGDLPKL